MHDFIPLGRRFPRFARFLVRVEPWLTGTALVLGWIVMVRCGAALFLATYR